MEEFARVMLGGNETLVSDFMKFNKAIDDLMAKGMSEKDAIDSVSANWKFPEI